jgi:DNA-directed RNA polymerase subunit delta
MKRVIVDYSKLTGEILNLLVEKFPDGYDDSDIIRFKNAKNETIEAVEVRTVDTIFLVKISMKLSDRIINYDEDDEIEDDVDDVEDDSIDALKELDIDDDAAAEEEDDIAKIDASDSGDDDDDEEDDDTDDDEPSDNDADDDDEEE